MSTLKYATVATPYGGAFVSKYNTNYLKIDGKEELNNNKSWPRGGRRREPNGGSFSTKNDNVRRPIPQRTKNFDKRPRTRGGYCNNACSVVGNEDAGIGEASDAELGSVFLQGSKKQSLNHLLNFQYTPYERQWNSGKISNTTKSSNRWIVTNKHKYNKEQFLQANCQFVVKASGNYKQYVNNPDALVDWDLIEQVNVQVSEFPSCPICLYPPVAAKMTQCGHVYCWSCMLHYLALSDSSSRKCPICYENVNKKGLKSVIPVAHDFFNVNDKITFKLMKRIKGSLIAYPADHPIDENQTLFSVSDRSTSTIYCKLLVATKNDVMAIIDRENAELETQICLDENAPERCFIEEAINLLTIRRNDLKEFHNSNLPSNLVVDNKHRSETTNTREVEDVMATFSIDDLDPIHCQSTQQQPTKLYYFYQASDGQHIYMHALNVRMLEHTYGSLDNSPLTITGKILEKESGSITEDIRKRLRYLQHLPVTCQFEVAEIELNESLVSKETLREFHDQIETRKKRRAKRAKEEKHREKRIAEAENRLMGKYPVANIQIDSHSQFPEFDGTGFEATLGSSPTNSQNSSSYESVESDYRTMSFAKMLTSPSQKKLQHWPQLKREETPSKLVNFTGWQNKPSVSSKVIKGNGNDSEPENYVPPVPEFNKSFHDALTSAFESTSTNDASVGNKGRKKKKNKQKLLFATSMTYGNI